MCSHKQHHAKWVVPNGKLKTFCEYGLSLKGTMCIYKNSFEDVPSKHLTRENSLMY